MTNQTATLLHRELTQKVIGAFFNTYNELGPGFPEFVCRTALAITLSDAGLDVVQEATLPVWFRSRPIVRFRVDMVVESVLLIEVKATRHIEPWHASQLRHYLKAAQLSVGLLLNFGPQPTFQRIVFETARTAHLSSAGPVEVDDASSTPPAEPD